MPSIEHMRLAALQHDPIGAMPDPATRRELRRAAGASRAQVAVALDAAEIAVVRAERGYSRLVDNGGYARLLGWFADTHPSALAHTGERVSA